jgi:hypothetical protein
MGDVRVDVVAIDRFEVVSSGDTLSQLAQLVTVERIAEFGLPDENDT